jgi:hypothetical protein
LSNVHTTGFATGAVATVVCAAPAFDACSNSIVAKTPVTKRWRAEAADEFTRGDEKRMMAT